MQQVRGGVEIKKNLKILLVTAACVVAADQAAKQLILAAFELNQSVEVIPGLFNLVYYGNPGAAFGIFNDGGLAGTIFLIGVSAVSLAVIGVLLRQAKGFMMPFALSLIAGGAAGNLIDRVRFGWVVDFLDFYFRGVHWPAFNVADSAITAGVFLAVLGQIMDGRGAGD